MDFAEILIAVSALILVAALIARHYDLARRNRQDSRDY